MIDALICDGTRTPFGRYGGALSSVRADDLAAAPLRALLARYPQLNPALIDEVILGCANQAGEDNRNVARMATLLAGLPISVPGVTVNRLCGSGLDAVGMAARTLRSGEAQLMLAGGVESMSRAPFVMPKSDTAFARAPQIFDTTIGWRFVHPQMKALHGVDSMPETAENVAEAFGIARADQDAFAVRSQHKALAAQREGRLAVEITPVTLPQRKGDPIVVRDDEHPRDTSVEALARLKGVVRPDGSVTAGNASGVNDGAAVLLMCNADAAKQHQLPVRARVLGFASAGVEPRLMGMGPVPATQRVLQQTGLSLDQMDVIELNEAFAAQALAVMRQLGLADDDARVNPNGGAIALGHPLGASGTRLVLSAVNELHRRNGRYALCTMCVGVGQGVALVLERL